MTEAAQVDLTTDAQWLVQALDPATDLTRLVRLDSGAYRQASFLDDRLFSVHRDAVIKPWADVARATERLSRADARWIFHIGHVGSTLLARLLGELPGVLSVREPRILRDLTVLEPGRRKRMLPALRKLLSRSFDDRQAALVKATSFVSELAAELVPANGRVLMMYAKPGAYMETILAGPNSIVEMRQLAGRRTERSAGRIADLPAAANDAELAALAWACEMTALEAAAEAMTAAVYWLDFDALLQDMPMFLLDAARALELDASPAGLRTIAAGTLTTRYSKDPSHTYTPALRLQLRSVARRSNSREIDGALRLLHKMTEKSALLARAMHRASN